VNGFRTWSATYTATSLAATAQSFFIGTPEVGASTNHRGLVIPRSGSLSFPGYAGSDANEVLLDLTVGRLTCGIDYSWTGANAVLVNSSDALTNIPKILIASGINIDQSGFVKRATVNKRFGYEFEWPYSDPILVTRSTATQTGVYFGFKFTPATVYDITCTFVFDYAPVGVGL